MEFLSRPYSRKGPPLTLKVDLLVFLEVQQETGFFSSYHGDFSYLLVWPQESPVSMQVASGLSGFLSSRCQVLVPQLELRLQRQGSSPVLTWISGFLWSFRRGFRPRLMRRHASPLSSCTLRVESGFLSSWHRDQWLSLEMLQGCHMCHRIVSRYLG